MIFEIYKCGHFLSKVHATGFLVDTEGPCCKHSCYDSLLQLHMSFQVLLNIKDMSSESPLLEVLMLDEMLSDAILK